jgi:hypothetical protein
MVTFVHIADSCDVKSIRRNGLKLPKKRVRLSENDCFKYGVFALPVTQNFIISHQWLRKLKRRGFRTAVGIYFRISDSEAVWAGKYNEKKEELTAAKAAQVLMKEEILGYEVVIPRSIKACEIISIRHLPQVLGWRHFPNAHGKPPFCGCSYCQRGNINSRRIRQRYENNVGV